MFLELAFQFNVPGHGPIIIRAERATQLRMLVFDVCFPRRDRL